MYVYDRFDLYTSHETIVLLNISFLKHSQLSPLWVLNVTEIFESLICNRFVPLMISIPTRGLISVGNQLSEPVNQLSRQKTTLAPCQKNNRWWECVGR